MNRIKTIQVKNVTKRRLDMLGRKGDSYDDIIRKLINSYVKARRPADHRKHTSSI